MNRIELSSPRDLLPDYYDGVHEMVVLMTIESRVMLELTELLERLRQNLYLKTAEESGISVFEAFYQISPVGDLDMRRQAILNRLLPPQPITLTYLSRLLTNMGLAHRFDLDVERSHLTCTVHNTSEEQGGVVRELLKRYLPVHLTYRLIENQIIASEGQLKAGLAHLQSIEI